MENFESWLLNSIPGRSDEEVEEVLRTTHGILLEAAATPTSADKAVEKLPPGLRLSAKSEGRPLKVNTPPTEIFAHALLSVVCDERRGSGVKTLARELFLSGHPISCVRALISHLLHGSEETWTLLESVMMSDINKCMSALCDSEMWQKLMPGKKSDECCHLLAGWVISIMEAAQKMHNEAMCQSFLPGVLLPSLLHALTMTIQTGKSVSWEVNGKRVMAVLLQRCLNRGFGENVAKAVLQEYQSSVRESRDASVVSDIVRCIEEPFATEKLFWSLLRLQLDPAEMHDLGALLKTLPKTSNTTTETPLSILVDRILLRGPLSKIKAQMIIDLLAEDRERLIDVTERLAKTWADRNAINHAPLPHQAYLTFLLTSLISFLPGCFAEVGNARLSRSLLQGVSNRLESSIDTIRFQGMRVARAIAAKESDSQPLFSDLGFDFTTLQDEEQWDTDAHNEHDADSDPSRNAPPEAPSAVSDSDDESDFCSSLADEDDPEPLETEAEVVLMKGQRPVTLIDLHQELKKSGEPLKVITALKQLTALVKQQPAELPSMAQDLSRTLVHVPLPDWIHEELKKDDAFELKGLKSSSEVRVRCLGTLLTAAPLHCGEFVASMIASKQAAEHQRLEILEALRHAAKELAATSTVTLSDSSDTEIQLKGKSHVWGVRSLAKAKEQGHTFKNRFVDVAGLWMMSLLAACRTATHGFDLLERNPMVLGSALVTISTFAECAMQSMASTALALSAFPLFKAGIEQKKDDCYLRRCTFQALAVLLKSIPTARLSSALAQPMPLDQLDETDGALREMLVWIQAQSENAVRGDSDETCRCLAAHCLQTYATVSEAALEFPSDAATSISLPLKTIQYRVPQLPDRLSVNKGAADDLFKDRSSA